jgi:hypothetical protein
MSRVCLRAILDFIYENFIIRVARVDDKKLQFVKANVVEADRSRFTTFSVTICSARRL